jgi:hypothetical protein
MWFGGSRHVLVVRMVMQDVITNFVGVFKLQLAKWALMDNVWILHASVVALDRFET